MKCEERGQLHWGFLWFISVSPCKLGTLRYIRLPMVRSTSTATRCQLTVPKFHTVQSETLRMSSNKTTNNKLLSKPRNLMRSICLRHPNIHFVRISYFHSQFDVPYSCRSISNLQSAMYKTHIIKEMPKEILWKL